MSVTVVIGPSGSRARDRAPVTACHAAGGPPVGAPIRYVEHPVTAAPSDRLRCASPQCTRRERHVIVCHCAVVGDRDIAAAAAAGASTLSQVCASTGAGRDCGSCVFSVRRILCESVGSETDHGLFTTSAEVDRAAS
ncbi:(2Fe-2S)-binding protein [Janibacter anophelis]|uniref:(2Fe-2S)-binding protein n=1 Tax=Janibacter anophelis TaxID=319054 RepID=UPI003F7EDD07